MSCGVGRRHSLDLVLLWLWHRPTATALIQPLVWEPPYATGVALKRKKERKVEKRVIMAIEKCGKVQGLFKTGFTIFKLYA